MSQVLTIDPTLIKVDPRLERITPRWVVIERLLGKPKARHQERLAEHQAEWQAFIDSIKEQGILEPLKLWFDAKKQPWLADGRHRLQGALELALPAVPYVEVSKEEAAAIMETTLLARRHMGKVALAYSAVVLHPSVAVEAKPGQPKKNSVKITEYSQADLAARFGVSASYIERACHFYREFSSSATLRNRYEHLIYDGLSFEELKVGIAGGDTTTGKPKGRQPLNIVQPLASVRTFFEHYSKLGPEQRDVMLEQGQKTLSESGEDFLIFMNELVSGAVQRAAEALTDGEEGDAP